MTRILVVEDNPDQALLIERVLTRHQPAWGITTVADGDSCLDRLSSGYELVVLDYSLPSMDGIEVLRRINADRPAMPVIMITGQGDERIAVQAMKAGAADYIVKTDHYLTNLPGVVEKVLQQARLKKELAETQRQLNELSQVSLDLSTAGTLDEAAQTLADGARTLTRSAVGLVVFLDPVTQLIDHAAVSHLTLHERLLGTPLDGKGLLAAPVTPAAPVIFPDVVHDPARVGTPAHSPAIEVAVVLPIKSRERTIGVLLVGNPESESIYRSDQMEALLNLSFNAANVTENLRSLEDARRQAITDGLTGLLNHRECQKRLAEETERAQRYGRGFSILMIDVDHFKTFNDTYGHQVGDLVLKEVAKRLTRDLRQVDLAARYGGEEFLVILPETTGEPAALVADRICRSMVTGGLDTPSGHHPVLTVSVGVASFPEDADSREGVIAAADHALYVAKESGRNQWRQYRRAMESSSMPREPEIVRQMFGDPTLQAVKDLATAIDAKSVYTRGHSSEVTRIAMLLADALALTDDQKHSLQIAGLLHNLGAVSIPDRILAKPGPLTAEERKIIQAHPGLAELLAQEAPRFEGVARAILYHHERWDGNGYPSGLRGEEIPRLARILGLVEAYHAMMSPRPYRRRLTSQEAMAELREEAGGQFDPFLVERFIEMISREAQRPRIPSDQAA